MEKVVHDPHLSRTGLGGDPDEFWLIFEHDPSKTRRRIMTRKPDSPERVVARLSSAWHARTKALSKRLTGVGDCCEPAIRARMAELNNCATELAKAFRREKTKMDAVALIAKERKRQIREEGWTTEHDREHNPEDLPLAGSCYAEDAARNLALMSNGLALRSQGTPTSWPWDNKWWKPTPYDPVRQLVKAGALIAAAIDRIGEA